jgi:hypothetical protein
LTLLIFLHIVLVILDGVLAGYNFAKGEVLLGLLWLFGLGIWISLLIMDFAH